MSQTYLQIGLNTSSRYVYRHVLFTDFYTFHTSLHALFTLTKCTKLRSPLQPSAQICACFIFQDLARSLKGDPEIPIP